MADTSIGCACHMGGLLRQRLAGDLVVIGGLVGKAWTAQVCGTDVRLINPGAPDHTLGALARSASGGQSFVLDLREAPANVATWLGTMLRFDAGNLAFRAPPRKAFDVLLYVDSLRSICNGSS